ncbi:hypothetical protein A3K63_04515 [Candidatus Micrarchaeota archaeon RBG_16_49_10]|nr:MAG: hypothetical protein A3K63_04515 [Candidatus Micrarchaeota archaeon RBG_16_49_10]
MPRKLKKAKSKNNAGGILGGKLKKWLPIIIVLLVLLAVVVLVKWDEITDVFSTLGANARAYPRSPRNRVPASSPLGTAGGEPLNNPTNPQPNANVGNPPYDNQDDVDSRSGGSNDGSSGSGGSGAGGGGNYPV